MNLSLCNDNQPTMRYFRSFHIPYIRQIDVWRESLLNRIHFDIELNLMLKEGKVEKKQKSLRWIFFMNIIKRVFDDYTSKILLAFDMFGVFLMMLPAVELKWRNFLPLTALGINVLGVGWIICRVVHNKEHRRIDETLRALREHTYHINAVKLSLSKHSLASCGGDRIVIVWNYPSGDIHARFKHDAWVGNIAFSKDETLLYSISGKGDLFVWDLLQNKRVKKSNVHDKQTRGLDISYASNRIVTAGEDGRIVIDDLANSEHLFDEKVSEVEIRKVAFDHGGTHIAYGNNNGVISIMDLTDFSIQELFRSPKNEMIRSVQFNHSDTLLAATDSGGLVTMIDIGTKRAYQMKCHNGHATCCDFSGDDAFIATGGQDNLIKIWKIMDSGLRKELEFYGHMNSVTNVVFNSLEDKLISAGRDAVIYEWNIKGLLEL